MKVLEVSPVTLEGRFVRLEPLSLGHAGHLAEACTPDIHQYYPGLFPRGETVDDIADYIRARQAVPNSHSFAVIDLADNRAVGCTSFMDIRPTQLGLEIGMTWYGHAAQGTSINPESKLLLLTHAFEVLGCERVQLKTDVRNVQSQRAIEKLGAVKEGFLRRHRQSADGLITDTVMYSIIPSEWAGVKQRLLDRLAKF